MSAVASRHVPTTPRCVYQAQSLGRFPRISRDRLGGILVHNSSPTQRIWIGCGSLGRAHENNDLDSLTCMEWEVVEGQLTVVLDECFDTIGLHRFFLHENCVRIIHYWPRHCRRGEART